MLRYFRAMRPPALAGVFLLAVASLVDAGSFVTNGPTNSGTRAVVDVPPSQHMRNTGGMGRGGPGTGAGLCVFTSCEIASRWQQVLVLTGFQKWMTSKPGGGYPEKLDAMIRQFCAERGASVPAYIQHTGGDDEFLDIAIKTGRCPCVTYAGSDNFYSGGIDHMVCLAHIDETQAAIIDNNRPGSWVWMSRKDFLSRWRARGRGWAVVFLSAPPPPYTAPSTNESFEQHASGGAAGGTDSAKLFEQFNPCPGGKCFPQASYTWETFPEGQGKTFLYHGSTFVGMWDGGWHPAIGPKTHAEYQLGDPPIPPPASATAAGLPSWALDGVEPERVHRGKAYWVSGSECSRLAAHGALIGDSLADDSNRWNVSVVGPKEFRDRVKSDLSKLDSTKAARIAVTFFEPGDWQVSQFGLPVGVALRKPAVGRVGSQLGTVGLDLYDLAKLLELLSLIDGPKPVPPPVVPGPNDPVNPPTPAPIAPIKIPDWAIVGGVLAFLLYLISGKKPAA